MTHIERSGTGLVPNLDGRAGRLPSGSSLLSRAASEAAVLLVFAGIAATAAWAGFLAWCVFYVIRSLLG